jgi:uncharacterized membrane protein YGL010W
MSAQPAHSTTSPLLRVLSQYASYHRCERNIKTHVFGVPMIVWAVCGWFGLLSFSAFGEVVSVMWILIAVASIYYLMLEIAMGAVMLALLVLCGFAVQPVLGLNAWLAFGIFTGVFVLGWALQFWGHHYEGRKPAFVDDLVGLLIGPVFVTAEVVFALGLRQNLAADIDRIAGPKRH